MISAIFAKCNCSHKENLCRKYRIKHSNNDDDDDDDDDDTTEDDDDNDDDNDAVAADIQRCRCRYSAEPQSRLLTSSPTVFDRHAQMKTVRSWANHVPTWRGETA